MANKTESVSWGDVNGMWEKMGRPYTKDDVTLETTPSAQNDQPLFEALPENPKLREIFLGRAETNL